MNTRKKTWGGAIGNVLEWYDFAIFGFLAPIMSPLFFPDSDPMVSLIKTYGVFAGGYLMRPIGGIFFGYIGDRFGRARALQLSILMMAVPTLLIGFLPTYEQIGWLAALLLIVMRLVQGVSVGGELVASMAYLVENSPPEKRGVAGSWSLFGSVSGVLLGSLTMTLLDWLLSAEALTAWGWRVPFIGGLVIFALGVWLRRDISEGQAECGVPVDKPSNPLREVLSKMPGRVLHISSALMLFSSSFYVLFVWFPTYLTKILPVPISHADEINLAGMTLLLASIFCFGSLSDRVGYKQVVLIGTAFITLAVYPLFVFVDHGSVGAALTAVLIFAIGCGAILGPMPALLVSSFPPNVRSSAIGLSYNITLAIFGGTAPLVATWFIDRTEDLASPAIYLALLGAISFYATIKLRSI
ncbi:MFS transporter [Roseobacter sp. AzwK-3b]|uniref:MFS transporter n=1 Tax=Roseobacter sp. AzwK-3b TaxID=351016 RepID=UPI0002F78E48|nr:MFS transporter [Roseobacter sp. AzwK-3b]